MDTVTIAFNPFIQSIIFKMELKSRNF